MSVKSIVEHSPVSDPSAYLLNDPSHSRIRSFTLPQQSQAHPSKMAKIIGAVAISWLVAGKVIVWSRMLGPRPSPCRYDTLLYHYTEDAFRFRAC